jgi:hypothetical protein
VLAQGAGIRPPSRIRMGCRRAPRGTSWGRDSATSDVLVGEVPAALTNPAYITLCLAFGIIGYLLAYDSGELFREGLFQFMTSFSLPWYAIVGA